MGDITLKKFEISCSTFISKWQEFPLGRKLQWFVLDKCPCRPNRQYLIVTCKVCIKLTSLLAKSLVQEILRQKKIKYISFSSYEDSSILIARSLAT
jgi:hypothetical protein